MFCLEQKHIIFLNFADNHYQQDCNENVPHLEIVEVVLATSTISK